MSRLFARVDREACGLSGEHSYTSLVFAYIHGSYSGQASPLTGGVWGEGLWEVCSTLTGARGDILFKVSGLCYLFVYFSGCS